MKLMNLLEYNDYTGWELILDEESVKKLKSIPIPHGWKYIAHHMTIGLLWSDIEGQKLKLKITAIGKTDHVIALKIESPIKTWSKTVKNDYTPSTPHITLAMSVLGSPKESNNITKWDPIGPLWVSGTVS